MFFEGAFGSTGRDGFACSVLVEAVIVMMGPTYEHLVAVSDCNLSRSNFLDDLPGR